MKFMLIFAEPIEETARQDHPVEGPKIMGAWRNYIGAMMQAGVMESGQGLLAPDTATTVRIRDNKREVQDGPYCDAKEYLGGYVIVDVDDLDSAINWAEKSPAAMVGSVEIRPVMPDPT